jgi:hypothetical protein
VRTRDIPLLSNTQLFFLHSRNTSPSNFRFLPSINSRMPPSPRDGLVWDDSRLDIVPVWTREPDLEGIKNVCRAKLHLSDPEPCDVTFFAQGAFNKLYLARTGTRDYIMRVSLPVHPHNITLGGVTTLRFLWRETNIPYQKSSHATTRNLWR